MICKECVYCQKEINEEWNEGDTVEPFCALKDLFTHVNPNRCCCTKEEKKYATRRNQTTKE